MIGNEKITIYHKIADRQWVKGVADKCSWQTDVKISASDRGLICASQVSVFIPCSDLQNPVVSTGDIIVRGECAFSGEISAKELLAQSDSITVVGVSDCRELPDIAHLEVTGK